MQTAGSPAKQADSTDEEQYSITELAREFGITTRAIRFYEDQGLLSPARSGMTRIYSERDRVRLKLVLRGKRLGFSLSEIAEIIDLYDADPGERGQLEHFLHKIAERRDLLHRQQDDIRMILEDLDVIEDQCHKRLRELKNSGNPSALEPTGS